MEVSILYVCICVGDGEFKGLGLIYQGIHVFSMTKKHVEFTLQFASLCRATIPTHPVLFSTVLAYYIYIDVLQY